MKKILNFLKELDYLMVILCVILCILVYCYAQLKIFHQEYINFCGYSIFHVITGSMEPTINIGDIVIVKITKEVDKDQIITYKYNNDFVTHRIIEKKEDTLTTKGDSNNSADTPINYGEVIGKVVLIITWSVWKKVLLTPEVMVAIFIAFVALWFIFFRKKDKRKINDKGNK